LDFLYAINPIATAVQGFRWALLGTPSPSLGTAAISSVCALLLLAGGYVYFRKTERFFADIV
jgi:lipopolysaccharide transport system permease protein